MLQAVEELAEVSKVFSQDRIQQRIDEQTIPAIPLAEKIVELPVIQTEEKTQQGMNTLTQHVVDTVEVERPTIIDETVQKPIIQEKINQVTKHVEVLLSQFTDKAMDIPVVAQRRILPMTQTVQKTIEIPQLQCIDEVIDVPAVLVVPVPQVQVSGKTVEILQLQTAEKIVDTFDANGNRVANELRRRDCVMREMRKNKPSFHLALNRAASDEIARHCKHCTERGVTRLYESGTALAEGMRVPVSKMEELIAAHYQTSLKTVKDPDRRPYPAYPSGKSWCEACGKMGSGQKFYHNVTPGSDFAAEAQQQHKSSKHQLTKQATRQERGGERKKEGNREGKRGRSEQVEGRDQEERKEEERKVEERGSEQVEKDAMDWTVVTRSKQKQRRVQIFVKVNGSKASPMEVSLTDDRVEDVMRRIQNDEDAYVTMHGRVLKKGERLKSCGVTDGCIVQVTSRLRGRGKHKDKKGQKERKRAAKPQGPEQKAVQGCDRDAAIRMIEENEESRKMMVRMLEENEDNQKMIESMSEGSDVDMEQTLQNYRTACRDVLGWDREQVGMMERGLRWAVEARRKERREEQEQRREEEQEEQRREEQEQRRQEEQEETRAESTDEPEVTSRPVEVRTGRGSAGLVRGGDGRHLADESNRKGKGKGNGGKGEHGGKGGVQVEEEEYRWDAKRKVVRMMKREEDQEANEEEQGRVAPNMGAGGSHPQATSDTREARVLSWADSKDEEARETTEERPPGLEEEEVENEPKTQQEEKPTQVESEQEAQELKRAQEAREEERKAQEAREDEEKRAQEAREVQRRAQEAREEQRRAQEAQEEKRAQEERERLAREAKAQEERERLAREANAQEERREQDREAVAQEGHEGEVKAQEGHGEDANSLHEKSHVSNRHMTWWRDAWWVRVNNGPHLQTARDRRKVWRAATRAAQEVRETGKVAGKERKEWEKEETERKESNTLHLVIHFPTATNATTATATVAAAAMRQHQ